MRVDELLFSESYSRFILACDESKVQDVLRICGRHGIPAKRVGTVVDSERFVLVQDSKPVVGCSVQEMSEAWSEAIPRMMGVAS
jgi:phosphoribosylformylglycinamidine (FGAM) synthase-like enzyme